MWKRFHVKYQLFLSDFNETSVFVTDFREKLKYKVLSKSVQWEPNCSLLRGRQKDGYDKANSRFSEFCERAKKKCKFK
jgi:hypothetical protein